MELIPGIDIGLDMVMGVMIKILLALLTLLSLIFVRQVNLMDKVVSLQVGGRIKLAAWAVFLVCLLITGIVMLG